MLLGRRDSGGLFQVTEGVFCGLKKAMSVLIVLLVNLAAAVALLCFALSIPFGASPTGRMLRARALGLLVALAILPVVIQLVVAGIAALGRWIALHPVTTIVTMLVVSSIAYGVLRLRGRSEQRPRRIATMQPYTHRRREADILSALRDELRDGDDG